MPKDAVWTDFDVGEDQHAGGRLCLVVVGLAGSGLLVTGRGPCGALSSGVRACAWRSVAWGRLDTCLFACWRECVLSPHGPWLRQFIGAWPPDFCPEIVERCGGMESLAWIV